MSQTSIVFGALGIAFLIYVAISRNGPNGTSDLSAWLSMLGI